MHLFLSKFGTKITDKTVGSLSDISQFGTKSKNTYQNLEQKRIRIILMSNLVIEPLSNSETIRKPKRQRIVV